MQDIDEKIRHALTAEDQKAIAAIDRGAGLFELMGMSFRGKQAWMMIYLYLAGFAVFVVLVYALAQYFNATDIKTSLIWMLGILTCMLMIVLTKLLAWQQMWKLELMREIKRLEMRIMLVNEKTD
jgi:peptidoglycan/LPS O-acetylase OafA/YrhL